MKLAHNNKKNNFLKKNINYNELYAFTHFKFLTFDVKLLLFLV
jgi:hypothetical protein